MFNIVKLKPAYENLLGFRQHFDTYEIDIPADLTTSETGEYYQDKHPALRLDYIQTTISSKQTLADYLREKKASAIAGIFNDILQYRQVSNYGKTLLEQAQLLNRHSWVGDKIVNQRRFVGLQIKVKDSTGLKVLINEIGIQLDIAQDITLYLFHSSKSEPIKTITITTTANGWDWLLANEELSALEPELFYGGVFVLGYYQDDLVGQAVNYSNFNWDKGECQGCNNGYYNKWQSVRNHFHVYPLYVPYGEYAVGEMFDLRKAIYCNDSSWGLNLKFTVKCDLTDFFIQNKFAFKNLLSLKLAHLVLNDMKYSQETNFVEENLKSMVIRDIEGDKETNHLNISQQYNRELKAVSFNISAINNRCLDRELEVYAPIIGQV